MANPFDDPYFSGGEGADDFASYMGPEFAELLRRPALKGLKLHEQGQVVRPTPQKIPDVFADYIQPAISGLGKAINTPYSGVKTALALGVGAVQGQPLKYIDVPQETSSLLPVEAKSPYGIVKQEAERFKPVQDFEQAHPFLTAGADVVGELGSQVALDPVLHGMNLLKNVPAAARVPGIVGSIGEEMEALNPVARAKYAGELEQTLKAGQLPFTNVVPSARAAEVGEAALGAAFLPGMVQGAAQGGYNAYRGYQEHGLTPEVFREGLQTGVDVGFTGLGAYHLGRGLQQLVAEGRLTPAQAKVVETQSHTGEVTEDPMEAVSPEATVPEAFQNPNTEPLDPATLPQNPSAPPPEPVAPATTLTPQEALPQGWQVHFETSGDRPINGKDHAYSIWNPEGKRVAWVRRKEEAPAWIQEATKPEAALAQPAKPTAKIGQLYDVPAIEQPPIEDGMPGVAPHPPKQRNFEVPPEPVADTIPPAEEYSPENLRYKAKKEAWVEEAEKKYWAWYNGTDRTEPAPVPEAPPEPPAPAVKKPKAKKEAPVQAAGDLAKYRQPQPPALQDAFQKAKDALQKHGVESPEYRAAHREWMRQEAIRNEMAETQPEAQPEQPKKAMGPSYEAPALQEGSELPMGEIPAEPVGRFGEPPAEEYTPPAPEKPAGKAPLPTEGQDLKEFGQTRKAEIEAHLKALESAGESKPLYDYAAQLGIEGFKAGKRRDGVKRTIESIGRHLGWGEGEEGPVPGFTRTGGGYWEYAGEGAKLKVYPRRSQGGIPPVLESFEGEPGAVEAAARTALARLKEHGQLIGQVKINVGTNEGQYIANKLTESGHLKPVLKNGKPDVYQAKNGAVSQTFEYLKGEKKEEPAPARPVEKPATESVKLISKLKASTKEGREKELVQTLSRIQRESPGSMVDIDPDLVTTPMIKRLEEAGLIEKEANRDTEGAYLTVTVPKRGVSKMAREEDPERVARVESVLANSHRLLSSYTRSAPEQKQIDNGMFMVQKNLAAGKPALIGVDYWGRRLIHRAYFQEHTRLAAHVTESQAFTDFPSLMDTVNAAREKVGVPTSDKPPKFLANGNWNAVYEIGDKHVLRLSGMDDGPYLTESFMLPVVDHPRNEDGFRADLVPKIIVPVDEDTGRFKGPLGKSHQEFYADLASLQDRINEAKDEAGDGLFFSMDIKDSNVGYLPDGTLVVSDLGAVEPSFKYKTDRWLQTDAVRRAERLGNFGYLQEIAHAIHQRDGVEHTVIAPTYDKPTSSSVISSLLDRGDLFKSARDAWEGIREIINQTSHLVGFTPDHLSYGFWYEGGVSLNPLTILERARHDRQRMAEEIIHTLLHEAAHDNVVGHGAIFDDLLASYLKQVEPHFERLVNGILESDLSEESMASLAQAQKEHLYDAKEASDRPGERGLAPIKDQPSRPKTSPRGSEAVRLLTGGDLRASARRETGGVGPAPGTPERARNFKEWFGDSKVSEEDSGRPIVVYHGTRTPGFTTFQKFTTGELGPTYGNFSLGRGLGFFFTASREEAGDIYAKTKPADPWDKYYPPETSGNVMPVYLSIKNPFKMDTYDPEGNMSTLHLLEKVGVEKLKEEGYDGIYIRGGSGWGDIWVAFEPEQIKSAIGNQGTFSKSDPDIRRMERPQPTPEQEKANKKAADAAIARAEAKKPDPAADKVFTHEQGKAMLHIPTTDDLIEWLDAKPAPKRRKDGTMPHDIARNLPRTELDADARARLGPVYEILNKDLTRSRPVHWADVSEAAKAIFQLKSPDEFVRFAQKRGFALRPEEDAAARMLVSSREKELLEIADTVRDNPEKAAEMEDKRLRAELDWAAAATAMAESGSGAARTLALRRVAAQALTPEETRLGKLMGALRQMKVPEENRAELRAKFMTKDPSFADSLQRALDPRRVDKALEFWKAGLVSGPATKLANLSSNALFRQLRDVENLVGVGVDVARSAITGTARERTLGEMAFAYQMYGKIIAGEDGAFSQWLRGHGKIMRLERLTKEYASSKFDIEHPGFIEGDWGEFVRSPFKSLEVDDTFFKHLSAGLEVARRAWRRALKQSGKESTTVKATQIYAEMMDLVRHGQESPHWKTKGYEAEFKEIEQQMLRDTFQNPLEKFGQSVMQLQQSSLILQVLLPFVKTPANIAKEAILRTPYGFWKTFRKIKSGELKGGAAAEEFAKPLLGTMLGMTFAMAAMEGKLTGGGPGDSRKEENLKETGWQPYSVHIGNQYISYQRLEPLSSIMGMAADFAEGVKDWDQLTAARVAQRIVGSVTENLTNKTFLSGLEGFFTFWHDPLRYGERYAKQLTSSLVPNIVGAAAKAVDPAYRKTGIFTAPLAKIPGVSQLLPAQKTPTGQVRERPGSALERFASPFARSVEKGPEADVNREMNRIGYVPAAPRDTITFRGKKVDLTTQEVETLEKSRVRATQALLRVIRDPSYRRLPDTKDEAPFGYKGRTKADVLEHVYRKYMDQARDQVKPAALHRAVEHLHHPLT